MTIVVEKYVVVEALKERHLTGQSVRAVTMTIFFLSAVGATPKDYRCRFLAFPLQIFVRNIYFDCCLYTKIKVLHRT